MWDIDPEAFRVKVDVDEHERLHKEFLESSLMYELLNGTKQIKAAYRDGMGVGVLVGFMLAAVTIAIYIFMWSEL